MLRIGTLSLGLAALLAALPLSARAQVTINSANIVTKGQAFATGGLFSYDLERFSQVTPLTCDVEVESVSSVTAQAGGITATAGGGALPGEGGVEIECEDGEFELEIAMGGGTNITSTGSGLGSASSTTVVDVDVTLATNAVLELSFRAGGGNVGTASSTDLSVLVARKGSFSSENVFTWAASADKNVRTIDYSFAPGPDGQFSTQEHTFSLAPGRYTITITSATTTSLTSNSGGGGGFILDAEIEPVSAD